MASRDELQFFEVVIEVMIQSHRRASPLYFEQKANLVDGFLISIGQTVRKDRDQVRLDQSLG